MSGSRGFTLLEVIIALVVVGLGVVTLLEIFSLGLRLGARSTVKTDLALQSRQIMGEVLIEQTAGEVRERENAENGFRWRLRSKPVQDTEGTESSDAWGLREVTLEVNGSRNDRQGREIVRTLLLSKQNRGP